MPMSFWAPEAQTRLGDRVQARELSSSNSFRAKFTVHVASSPPHLVWAETRLPVIALNF